MLSQNKEIGYVTLPYERNGILNKLNMTHVYWNIKQPNAVYKLDNIYAESPTQNVLITQPMFIRTLHVLASRKRSCVYGHIYITFANTIKLITSRII